MESIDRFGIGWDGEAITVPIRTRSSSIVFFERWDGSAIGVPLDQQPAVELFGWQHLLDHPERVVVAEGVYEALIFESAGIPAVAATGSGRFFKSREWTGSFSEIAEVLITYKAGDKVERRPCLLSRQAVREKIRFGLPQAEEVLWPAIFKRNQGAFEFFVVRGGTREEFLALARR